MQRRARQYAHIFNLQLTHGIFLKSSKTSELMKRDLASSFMYSSSIDLHHLRKPLGSYVYSSTNLLASSSLSALWLYLPQSRWNLLICKAIGEKEENTVSKTKRYEHVKWLEMFAFTKSFLPHLATTLLNGSRMTWTARATSSSG